MLQVQLFLQPGVDFFWSLMRITVFVLVDVFFFFDFQGFRLGFWDFEKFANVFFVFEQVPFDLIFHQDPLFFVGEVERLKWYV